MNKLILSKDRQNVMIKLKIAREEAGLSQKRAAKLLNKTQSYISKIESRLKRLDVFQLKEISQVYKKDINYFFK